MAGKQSEWDKKVRAMESAALTTLNLSIKLKKDFEKLAEALKSAVARNQELSARRNKLSKVQHKGVERELQAIRHLKDELVRSNFLLEGDIRAYNSRKRRLQDKIAEVQRMTDSLDSDLVRDGVWRDLARAKANYTEIVRLAHECVHVKL